MGQKPADDGKNEPSLELPSLSLKRLRRKKATKKEATEAASTQERVEPAPPAADTGTPTESVTGPVTGPEEPTTQIPAVREEPARDGPPTSGPPATDRPTTQLPATDPAPPSRPPAAPAPSPAVAPPPAPLEPAPPAPPLFVEQSLREPADRAPADREPADRERDEGEHVEHEPEGQHPERGRAAFSLPPLPGRVAALITGAVVGLFGAVLTYLAMMGCEVVQGTSSCGRPGFFLLLAVLALMVLLGGAALKAWQITDPGSTSLLAVGVLSVIVLVVLIDVVFSGWMFVLVPVLSALSYAFSHWVTTRFIEEPSRDPAGRDERSMDVR